MEPESPFASNPIATRDDLAKFLVRLLDALEPCTSPGGALVKIGWTAAHFDERAAQLEGFARPLWALGPLLAGGFVYPGAARWSSGLANGTDPSNHAEFWGFMRDRDQRMVECSPIGFALALAGRSLWDPLTDEQKQNVETWLTVMNNNEMPNTNWLWFRVFANLGMLKVGSNRASRVRMEADLNHLDTFFIPSSNGWSRDGPEGVLQLDYYSSSFAIQFAQLVYAKLAEDRDPERSARYKDRARAFAHDFIFYFDPEGRAIPFGRSNTYRFAQSSFWGALAFADVDLPEPLTWGVVKGLQLRNLRYWAHEAGAFTREGLVTIGYNYPNMNMTDNYNSPGSPYWCCKSFITLALPESHPFWSATETPIPYPLVQPPALFKPLQTPMHIAVSHPVHTYILSSGQMCSYLLKHSAAKYGKFAYSSAFGFSFPTGTGTLEELGGDSTLAITLNEDLGHEDGEFWRTRRVVLDPQIEYASNPSGKAWLRSLWKPFPDTTIETFLIPPDPAVPFWHVRAHHITFSPDATRKVSLAEGGWATYGQGRDGRTIGFSAYWSSGSSGFHPEVPEGVLQDTSAGSVLAASSAGVVGIADLSHKFSSSASVREPKAVKLDPNSNIVFSRAICPSLVNNLDAATTKSRWLVTAVFGLPYPSGRVVDWQEEWRKQPTVPENIQKLIN